MPLINTSVPNLLQGVSQQSDATRFAGQCEEQENALSSIAEGLIKRPNSNHVRKLLETAISEDSFVHFIDRSPSEKYVVIHDGTHLYAFNLLTGVEASIQVGTNVYKNSFTTAEVTAHNDVSAGNTTTYVATGYPVSGSYLDSLPNKFKALTLGDNTILLNTSRVTATLPDRTPPVSNDALLFIKQGDYGTKYEVSIQGNFTPQAGDQATATTSISSNNAGTSFFIVGTPSIQNSGSGYEQGFVTVTARSNGTIISQPQFQVNVSNGSISSIVRLSGGSFAPVRTGSVTLNHQCTISNFTDTDDNDAYSTFGYRKRKIFSFDVNIISGDTSHLSIGQSIDITMDNDYFIEYYDHGGLSTYDDASSPSYQRTFTGELVASNKIHVERTYSYYIDPPTSSYSSIPTRYSGEEHRVTGGFHGSSNRALNDLFNGNGTASFSSTAPTNGSPTVTLSISAPTTSVSVARIDASIRTPQGDNAQDFNASGGLSGNGSINDRREIDTSVIAANLRKNLQSKISAASQTSNFSVTNAGNLVVVSANAASIVGYTISASDGLANSGMGVIYKEVGSISDLPIFCKNDFTIKVVGEQSEVADDFYVKFQTNDGSAFGRGVWVETVGYDEPFQLDSTTLPHLLVSTAENEFNLSPADGSTTTTDSGNEFTFESYKTKKAGDANTNPSPSFIGKTISNLFFFKNRLGFLSGSSLVLSEDSFFFNFFRTTVTTFLDSAPIDIEVGSNRVTNLKAATGFQGDLILFSENEQFLLRGGEILTPRTVSVAAITNFEFEDKVEPLPLGSYIYFPFTRGSFTGIREFAVNSSTDVYDSVEITEQVPAYIPKDITSMKGTTSENIIVALSKQNNKCLYVYKYFWSGNKKVLSSWSKFEFHCEVMAMEFVGSTLYTIITNGLETNLTKIHFESGLRDAVGYTTHLDMRVLQSPDVLPLAGALNLPWVGKNNNANLVTTYETSEALHMSGIGNIATLSFPATSTTITGEFKRDLAYHSAQNGNFLRILDASNNTLFSHEIKNGTNTFTYTPAAGSADATSMVIFRSKADDVAGSDHELRLVDIKISAEISSDSSTITLPYIPYDDSIEVYTQDGVKLPATNSGATITLSQALPSLTKVWCGIPYTMKYTFSEQLFKAKAGNATTPSNAAKLMVRNGSIYYDDSRHFKVIVTPDKRDSYTNTFDSTELDSGFYRFPVFTKAEDTTISIENDSAFPSTFQSAEFESFTHSRSNRYG